MTNQDTRRELEGLRAEVAELKQSGNEQASAVKPAEEGLGVEANENFKNQFVELSGLLEKELKERPTSTALMVFAVGVLLGRVTR